jgi:hypothetical protein
LIGYEENRLHIISFLIGQLSFPEIIILIIKAPICPFIEEVVVRAGRKVLEEVNGNCSVIVGDH